MLQSVSLYLYVIQALQYLTFEQLRRTEERSRPDR